MNILFKKTFFAAQLVLIALFSFSTVQAAGEVDPTFNPALVNVVNSNTDFASIYRMAVQPDGKIIIAGFFRVAGKFNRDGIARLNADGTVDPTFRAPVITSPTRIGGNIYAVALQPDGKILIAGAFTQVGFNNRLGVARLTANGSLDTSFNLPGNTGSNFARFNDIKVAADGKITFAGRFQYSNLGNTRFSVARVLADGTLDPTFVSPPEFNNFAINLYRVELLPDGKTLVAGGDNTSGVVHRLNADGTIDTTFSTIRTSNPIGGNSSVLALRVQADGKYLIGGGFQSVNGFVIKGIARFNADGSLDTSFNLTGGPNFVVFDIEISPSGMILVGGDFTTYNGESRNNVALLDSGGNLSSSLNYAGTRLQTKDVAFLPDGKILVGGEMYGQDFPPALIRLNADGSLDSTFNLIIGALGRAYKVIVQPDGKILIGGFYTHVDSQLRSYLSRVNADGTLDTGFTPPAIPGEVLGLDFRASDGKIFVSATGGLLRLNANGTSDLGCICNVASYETKFLPGGGAITAVALGDIRLRKLLESGAYDPSLNVLVNGAIKKILLQPDGKFIVVGDFTQIGGITRSRIARVNGDGLIDATFNPGGGANNSIFDAALQADGKIIIGGNFSGFNFDTNYQNLARLNADGSLDMSFNPIVVGGVQSLKIQANGRILVGGAMSLVNGAVRRGIAQLNANGSLDAAFDPGAGADNSILTIDTQANGRIVIGGIFTLVNNVDRLGVARLLDSSLTARTPYDFDGDGKADLSVFRPSNSVWYQLNSTNNQQAGQQFGASGDVIAPADFDGDGKTDLAVYRGGVWYIQRSALGFTGVQFGLATDLPVPADYDGDGKADIAVWRPSNGTWYRLNSSNGQVVTVQFGQTGDKPTLGDFDGNGLSDIAVFRPSNGVWYRINAQNQQVGQQFGQDGDSVVPADYDGDGKTDLAVYRPAIGTWYILRSSLGFTGVQFGSSADKPAPADYDGDGRADVTVFRPSNGVWYQLRSTQGFAGTQFGITEDLPIPNAFVR
ncbi:MAG: FG-GAP-like repeat-containing protein [Pyrinomonadaceae bacterium]|nr:FG-GAP-like repeat-containing protein [Pyrinomonadaceae bacterium]